MRAPSLTTFEFAGAGAGPVGGGAQSFLTENPHWRDRPPSEGPARLLIVDDVADNREVLARRFRRKGYETIEAEGGAEALRLLNEQDFDLVLLDIVMPDVDGLAVLARLRESKSESELPVIMVTGKSDSADVVEALRLGASDYLTKPVDFAVASARVDVQIGRRRAEAELSCASNALREMNAELEKNVADLKFAIKRAEEANRAKSEFLANMSHEIRTPLNGVLGLATVLVATELDPRQKEMVEVIVSSAGTLERLLTDVLDLARVEAGRLEIHQEPFDLDLCVRTAFALCKTAADLKGIDIRYRIEDSARGAAEGDAARLQQILINLLSNAVKFTATGGVTLVVTQENDLHHFNVVDTGVGFDAGLKERLFTRFEQADGSIVRQYGGTGLGLAISRELAGLLGGTLDCVSAPGEGSTFTLVLPLAPEMNSGIAAGPAVFPPASGTEALMDSEGRNGELRVLLAEDHPVNRMVVKLMLENAAVDLTCVENGEEAVEAFRSSAFDLVLMDMQMPVMDGLSAIHAIREIEKDAGRQRTTVIMLTANGLPEHVEASLKAGADGQLNKPVDISALLKAVSEVDARLLKANGPLH